MIENRAKILYEFVRSVTGLPILEWEQLSEVQRQHLEYLTERLYVDPSGLIEEDFTKERTFADRGKDDVG